VVKLILFIFFDLSEMHTSPPCWVHDNILLEILMFLSHKIQLKSINLVFC